MCTPRNHMGQHTRFWYLSHIDKTVKSEIKFNSTHKLSLNEKMIIILLQSERLNRELVFLSVIRLGSRQH